VALAVSLEAVALKAFTLDFNDSFVEKQLFFISAIPAFAAGTAGLTEFEAFAVIFLAFGLGACALSDWEFWEFRGFGVVACGCRGVGGFQISGLAFFGFGGLDGHRGEGGGFVVVGE
jgi:hypothetical protein